MSHALVTRGCVIRFYQVNSISLESTLLRLCHLAYQRTWHTLILTPDDKSTKSISDHLWHHTPPDVFMPHDVHPSDYPVLQPILLGRADVFFDPTEHLLATPPNTAECLIVLGDIPPECFDALGNYYLVCVVFSKLDTETVETMRGLWRRLRAAGVMVESYFETNGHWQKNTPKD